MFLSNVVVLTFSAIAGLVAASTPPPCLLAAVNTQPNPADLKSICGQNATYVQKTIAGICNSDVPNALAAFADTCKSAGVTVSSYTATATGSSSTGTSVSLSSNTSSGGATANATPTVVVYSWTYYNSSCSCTKTEEFTATSLVSGASATTTGNSTVAGSTAKPTSTGGSTGGSSTSSQSNGASGRTFAESLAALAMVVAAAANAL